MYPSWPPTQSNLPASASAVLGLYACCWDYMRVPHAWPELLTFTQSRFPWPFRRMLSSEFLVSHWAVCPSSSLNTSSDTWLTAFSDSCLSFPSYYHSYLSQLPAVSSVLKVSCGEVRLFGAFSLIHEPRARWLVVGQCPFSVSAVVPQLAYFGLWWSQVDQMPPCFPSISLDRW